MSDFSRSLAVVIGIDRYGNGIPPLETAANDARALGALLGQRHGYDVRLLLDEDATLPRLMTLLTSELPGEIGPDDRVFFYFAGHGVALDGDDGPQGFLLPQDARRESADSFLRMPVLHDALGALRCRHLLAVLDCCFAGAFRWSSMRDVVPLPSVLHQERYDRFIQDPAWQVITSTAHDQQALDVLGGETIGARGEAEQHSPFARVLLDGLLGAGDVVPAGGGDGVITATELYVYLDDALALETLTRGKRQTPGLWPLKKHDKGQYIFLAPGHQLNLPPAPELTSANNPYRGLAAFEEEHKDLFFGRERVVQRLLAQVAGRGLTVVVGASGTGKSSLVRAGLVPALRHQGWEILPVVRPGTSPLKSLAAALTALGTGARESGQGRLLQTEPQALANQIAAWGADHPDRPVLLVIDQLEELVTMCREEGERDRFVQLLANALQGEPTRLWVVLTVRSDFEPQFAGGILEPLWQASRFVGPPMTQDELREAIEKPASERVLYFEPPTLVDELINEVVQTPGALPLLSFTLSEMYVRYLQRHDTDRALTRTDYESLGGVIGSLRHRASEEYANLDAGHQATMRRVMLRMVSLEGSEVARRRVSRAELEYSDESENARVRDLIDRLSAVRLVVEGRETEGEPYVEPAHDELVRGWDKLWEWIRAERQRQDDLAFQRRLTQAAQEWQRTGEESARAGLLWQDPPRSALLEQVLKAPAPWPNRVETAFARQSIRRRTRNLRVRVGAVAAISLTAIATSVAAGVAIKQAALALSRELSVQSATLLNDQLDVALLLSLEAYRAAKTFEARRSLLTGLQFHPRLLAMLHGHQKKVNCIACSPDGRTCASVGDDSSIILWDVARQQPLAPPLPKQGAAVSSVAFSPDGRMLVSTSADSTIRLWDVKTHSPLGPPLTVVRDLVRTVAFSPDGKFFASGGDNGTIIFWDAGTRQQLGAPLSGHEAAVWMVTFSPDGKKMASASDDGTVIVWNVANRSRLSRIAHAEELRSVAFSPDGRTLALGTDEGSVILWDLPHDHPLPGPLIGHKGVVFRLAFTTDGKTLVSGASDSTIILWDVAKRRIRDVLLAGHDGAVLSLAFTQGEKVLASGQSNGNVDLWAVQAPVLNVGSLTGHTDAVWAVAFSPDGKTLASGGRDGELLLWDVATRQWRGTFVPNHRSRVLSVAFSPDGETLASGNDDSTLILWSTATRQPLGGPLNHGGVVSSLSFSQNRRTLASGGWDGTVKLWDLSKRELAQPPLAGDQGGVQAISFSPDGSMLASGGHEGGVILWDMASGRAQAPALTGHRGSVNSLTFSPDGRTLASGSSDSTVILWKVASRNPVGASLVGHNGEVFGVAFSPDGKTLASGGDDGGLILWDLTAHQALGHLFLDDKTGVSSVVFSPDGKTLAVGNWAGVVVLEDVSLDSWMSRACRIANRNLSLQEWNLYLPGGGYHRTCSDLPPGKGAPSVN